MLIVRQEVRAIKSRSGRRLAWALAVAGFLGSAAGNQAPSAGSAAGRHVLVISVDGLGAYWYMAPPTNLRIPNLLRLKSQGSFAEGVEGVYPSVTYPSHTTLVTGRLPAEHGVYSNLSSREPGKSPRDWFWFSSAIKVPTLWDEARRAQLSSAAVFWPVTAGADIDWDIPEIWDPQVGPVGDPVYVAKFATPGLLFDALLTIGSPPPATEEDITRTRLSVFVLKNHKPNLMLVHLAGLDEAEHKHGPRSEEAARTLERTDERIGEILAAVKESGLENSTDVFIVSDHGFLPLEREIRPNVLLVKAGLLTADAQGAVSGGKIETVSNGGSFFIYWPEGLDLRGEIDAALRPLGEQGLVWGVLNRQALHELGAEPAAQMALEAPEGAGFDSRAAGDLVVTKQSLGGSHGYLPFRKGLEAAFIAWGPGVRGGVNLHRIRMTAIGPTLLKAMGVTHPQFGTEPPLSEILK